MIDRNTNVQITDEALAFAKPMLAPVRVLNLYACLGRSNVQPLRPGRTTHPTRLRANGTMTKKKILKELRGYLSRLQVGQIEMIVSIPRSPVFFLIVADTMREYNSTQENEDKVCDLLCDLARLYFKPNQP